MRCPQGEYNFKSGGACKTCPSTGAICNGGTDVSAKKGYYGYLGESSDGDELSMFLCPEQQCCNQHSCVINGTTDCASTRDPKTPLCGSCMSSLSETLGSVDCKHCSGINWLYMFTRFLLYCVLLCYLYCSAKSVSKDAITGLQIIVTKCLAYFYQVHTISLHTTLSSIVVQVLPLLVDSISVIAVLQPLMSVFALKMVNGNNDGQCLIEGMDSMEKLLVLLVGPLFMVLAPCLFILVYWLSRLRTASQGDSTRLM